MGELYCMPSSWCGGGGSTTPKPTPTDATDGGMTSADGGELPGEVLTADGGEDAMKSGGGCTVAGSGAPGGIWLIAAAFLIGWRRRRHQQTPANTKIVFVS